MRFDSIEIPAFGPFTSFGLALPESEQDVHVIFGSNEAGKSSLLRALHGLLYGVPHRTSDTFLHEGKKIRIGATVREGDDTLSFYRKKARAGSLVDESGKQLSEGALGQFIGATSQSFFEHMFGLDTAQLRAGADQLLAGEGEVGALLFSASLGGTRIDRAIDKLQEEADSLAKGASRKKEINLALARLKDCEKRVREESMLVTHWKTLNKDLEEAERSYAERDSEFARQNLRKEKLKRYLAALPSIGHRAEVIKNLAEINLPDLPEDFVDQVRQWQKGLSNAQAALKPLEEKTVQLKQELAGRPVNQAILDEAAQLDGFHQGIAGYIEREKQLDQIGHEMTALESRLDAAVGELGLTSVCDLRALPVASGSALASLEEVAEKLQEARRRKEESLHKRNEAVRQLKENEEALAGLDQANFPDEWEALLRRVDEYEQNRKVAESVTVDLERQTIRREKLRARLKLESTAAETRLLAPPSAATITKFASEEDELRSLGNDLAKRESASREELAELDFRLQKFKQGNRLVVTKADLQDARRERDRRWEVLTALLDDGEKSSEEERESFQQAQEKADRIADQLLNESEETALAAQWQLDRDRGAIQLERILAEKKRLAEKEAKWETSWREVSGFLKGREFRIEELQQWLQDYQQWQEVDEAALTLEERQSHYRVEETALQDDLRQALGQPDASLGALNVTLRKAKTRAEESAGEQRAVAKRIEELRHETARWQQLAASACEEEADWATGWEKQLAELKLTPASPKVVLAEMKSRKEAAELANHLADLTQNRQELSSLKKEFEDALELAFLRHCPERAGEGLDVVAREAVLNKLLTQARHEEATAANQRKELARSLDDCRNYRAQVEQAQSELERLAREAGADSPAKLDRCLQQHERKSKLIAEREHLEIGLTALSDTLPLEDFITECRQANADDLRTELEILEADLPQAKGARDEARDVMRGLQQRKRELEQASGEAARAKQEAEGELAALVTMTERFLRLHHAIDFLHAQVEAYRNRVQGPLVDKTSAYFRRLTLSSFAGVAVRSSDAGGVRLVALRQGDEDSGSLDELSTHELSEGTRDQLYLALRLAAIELHLESHQSMPLILDDVLMTFDDERAAELLRVLGDFSRSNRVQILIFTHHQHLSELAERTGITTHRMDRVA
ncbi:MAG: AAA family ATPase [Verrucomicrobiota bacterium JB023]|nr:AAA family ATPase [Verrucomicrobiota bacterium JB023]